MLQDAALSVFVLLRTWLRFRFGSRAVAAATRRAMSVTPMQQTELDAAGVDVWRTYHRFVRVKRLWPAPVMCLQTALCLHQILTIKGIRSAVRVGVSPNETGLDAHAWVEVGDFVLDDTRNSGRFAAFDPPAAPRSAR